MLECNCTHLLWLSKEKGSCNLHLIYLEIKTEGLTTWHCRSSWNEARWAQFVVAAKWFLSPIWMHDETSIRTLHYNNWQHNETARDKNANSSLLTPQLCISDSDGANALARQESFTLNTPPLFLSGTTETFFQTRVLIDSDGWYFKSSIAFLRLLNTYINVPRKIFEGNYSCLLLPLFYKWMHAKQGGVGECCLTVMLLGNSLISLIQHWCF